MSIFLNLNSKMQRQKLIDFLREETWQYTVDGVWEYHDAPYEAADELERLYKLEDEFNGLQEGDT